jgi:hypothetical protein
MSRHPGPLNVLAALAALMWVVVGGGSRGVRGAAAVAMTGFEGRTSDVEQIA